MEDQYKRFLVTGAAGFIGSSLCLKLLSNGYQVIGIDNINNYYDTRLKSDRLKSIEEFVSKKNLYWKFSKIDLCDFLSLEKLFSNETPDVVINLAAQAGVRYSIKNPLAYAESNLIGFANILEMSRRYSIKHLIYASSSSVYGGNTKLPFDEFDSVDHPVSFYAATKKSNELMAHSYSSLFNIPTTGLRFFTVYGPWGRPDMAPMIFAKKILSKTPIDVFNFGKMQRDFTYIDDIVEGVYKCCFKAAVANKHFDKFNPDPSSSFAPYLVFNIGNNKPINLKLFINLLEENLGEKAKINLLPMQPGDVENTFASNDKLSNWVDFCPSTNIELGVKKFANWYKDYYS